MIAQDDPYDQIVLPSPLGAGWRLWWRSKPCTSFTLARSDDDGKTFDPLDTFTYDVNGANQKNGRFFYDDSAGTSRSVYTIYSVGSHGTSNGAFAFAPAGAPDTCIIHAYAKDGFGDIDRTSQISVKIEGPSYASAQGAVAKNTDGMLLLTRERWYEFDENGHWQVKLPRLSIVRILIPGAEFFRLIHVPDEAGPINLRDLPALPQASYLGTWDKSDTARAEIIHS